MAIAAGSRLRRGGYAPPTRHLRGTYAPSTRRARATCASLARRGRGGGQRIGREGIGEAAGVGRQHLIPAAVEPRAGKAAAQALGARPRHARRAGRTRDAAGFEQGGKEDALPCWSPMGAIHAERSGGGRRGIGRAPGLVRFHPTGWSKPIPTLRAKKARRLETAGKRCGRCASISARRAVRARASRSHRSPAP